MTWTEQRWRIAQFFEARWWRSYLGGRDKKAYYDWKRAYWRDFVQQADVEISDRARILDAGCGPAGIFTILDQYRVDALDPLLAQYERTLPQFDTTDWPHVRFVAQPLETFVPDAAPYDVVFCLNAINHVRDLAACFDRLVELTAHGGTLVVSIDAHHNAWFKRAMQLIPGDILHPHQYDLEEYTRMLTDRGVDIKNTVLLKHEWIFDYYVLVGVRQ
jgi:SAM-dependent methyltransferase